jgi:phospholipid N-methyltransferase
MVTKELLGIADRKRSETARSRWGLFARNFFKHPVMLGSVIPSSRFLVNDLLAQVDWERARVFVEYGPGVGTITQHILRRMHPDAVLVAIELNDEFVEFLSKEIRDPRLMVLRGSASDARKLLASVGLSQADYVISGIPYSTFPEDLRREICEETRELVEPTGTHLVYQFTTAVLPYLKSNFGLVQQGFQPWNILPARIFHCTP